MEDDMAKKDTTDATEAQEQVEEPSAQTDAATEPQGEAPAPEPEPQPAPQPEAAPQAPAPNLEWFAGVPTDVPQDAEALAAEHEWQLEHNAAYQDQFAPKK